jgi:CheY-like chemotaxis protein
MNRILVIDDEKPIADLLEKILSRLGYFVKTAYSAGEGIELFDKELFDIVITDIVMPDHDGHAVVRHIRSSNKRYVPVMGISGTPWLLQEGEFDSFLPKPFGIKALTDALEKLALTNSSAWWGSGRRERFAGGERGDR